MGRLALIPARVMRYEFGSRIVIGLLAFTCFNVPGEVIYRPVTGFELEAQSAASALCESRLTQIMRAAQLWALDNLDQPPQSLEAITNELKNPSALLCPAFYHPSPPTNWVQMQWDQTDYRWFPEADWSVPTSTACACNAHANVAYTDGTVRGQGFVSGWPALMASPMEIYATPGETIRFELSLAPDVVQPMSYQWRKTAFAYTTNSVRVRDPENPTVFLWVTNVSVVVTGTNLTGQTNCSLQLSALETNASGFYDVVLSNRMGATLSRETSLNVSTSFSGMSTNSDWSQALCLSNLKQIWILAKIWSMRRDNLMPQRLKEMTNSWGSPSFGWPQMLFCRADTNRIASDNWAKVDLEQTSYEIAEGERPNLVDVFCRCRAHGYYVSMDGVTMPKALMGGIRTLPGGFIEFRFRTFAGVENVLESSFDLNNWSTLGVYGPDPLEVSFTDFAVEKRCFYRVTIR